MTIHQQILWQFNALLGKLARAAGSAEHLLKNLDAYKQLWHTRTRALIHWRKACTDTACSKIVRNPFAYIRTIRKHAKKGATRSSEQLLK